MKVPHTFARLGFAIGVSVLVAAASIPAQQMVTETRDPQQTQDEDFAKSVKEWTSAAALRQPAGRSPAAESDGMPTTKDVLGYYVGAPKTLTYYEDIVKLLPRAGGGVAARDAWRRSGRSDEGRELVVVWVSSERNLGGLQAEP
jgi:hypothetical protein